MSLFNKTKEEVLELEKKHNHVENCAKMDAKTSTKFGAPEAIKTLIIGCRLAQKEGTYTLEEARTIMNAIDFLNSAEEK